MIEKVKLFLSKIFGKDDKPLSIVNQLDQIGYFDLIDDEAKKKSLKEKIDFEYNNDYNGYGKGWLVFPNDYYISDIYGYKEYNNGSSTSDFRAFEVCASSLFRGEFMDYMKSAKPVFEKNNIELFWEEEIFDENSKEKIHHRIKVNNKDYVIFSGCVGEIGYGKTLYTYLKSFRQILNDVIERQEKKYQVILVTQIEWVIFVLLEKDKIEEFKKILSKTENKIEL